MARAGSWIKIHIFGRVDEEDRVRLAAVVLRADALGDLMKSVKVRPVRAMVAPVTASAGREH
jgi:hypothetical protein